MPRCSRALGSTSTSRLPRYSKPGFLRSWRPSRAGGPALHRGGLLRAGSALQRAGQHASDRSAYLEAISHCTTGIELLTTLPKTPEHTQQAVSAHRPRSVYAHDQRHAAPK